MYQILYKFVYLVLLKSTSNLTTSRIGLQIHFRQTVGGGGGSARHRICRTQFTYWKEQKCFALFFILWFTPYTLPTVFFLLSLYGVSVHPYPPPRLPHPSSPPLPPRKIRKPRNEHNFSLFQFPLQN
jgi:hypothetical protein